MRHPVRPLTTFLMMLLVLGAPALVRADVTVEQIDNAINKCKQYLYSKEKNGNWETVATADPSTTDGWRTTSVQWGGVSALATYSLLAAGDNAQGPQLLPAITWLQSAPITGIYALGMRSNVWEQLPQTNSIKKSIRDDGDALVNALHTTGASAGMYDYKAQPPTDVYDHSVSQYGVLGVWAAQESDIFEVPSAYWEMVEKAWIAQQDPTGGWCYGRLGRTNLNIAMTAAGIATLYLTQDYLHANEQMECRGNYKNPHIDLGIKWLTQHFHDKQDDLPGDTVVDFYTWYGIERIGVASGYKYFGDNINWFKEGAAYLIGKQAADGGFHADFFQQNTGDVPNTCFALLFLSRGRAAVMINKLKYNIDQNGDTPVEANWNERSLDAKFLSKWTGRQTEHFLNWQIVSLNNPMSDLHEAPILYIAGDHKGLNFTQPELDKLKQFVEEGGLIVGNADCGSRQFAEAFRKLGNKIFPFSEFRKLPNDHILFHNQFDRKKWTDRPDIEGLSNGARELMLLFPNDPARYWQVRTVAGHESSHQLMVNVWMYVTEKHEPLLKGQTYVLTPNGGAAGKSIKVARIKYAGNWDPEPGGWRRLSAYMHNVNGADLDVETVNLGDGKLDGFKVAHLTGTFKFALTADQQAELRKFVEGGGTLIIDSCGGVKEFTAAAETQLQQIFGAPAAQLKTPLKPANPAFQAAAVKVDQVEYRRYAQQILGGKDMHAPRLRGFDVNGKGSVFFSPEDLSVGLVGEPVDGIYGYAPIALKDADTKNIYAGASEIMSSLLMYGDAK